MDDERYILWLTRINGVGLKRQRQLMEYFGSAKGVFLAPRSLLKSLAILNPHNVHEIVKHQEESIVKHYEQELKDKNIVFRSMYHPGYPPLLREIDNSPLGLYISGQAEVLNNGAHAVSIIGARRCTAYGLEASYKLSHDLAAQGLLVISGMARGIDSMSHKGALEGGGLTVAVLGCGVDICYPSENRRLYEQIKKNGCILSEHPPGTTPMPGFFPMRNRIISGLSMALVVVEAGEKSGTLITVDQALQQGRDVLCVPGNITSKLSIGTNRLIKEGLPPVTCYEDVLFALGLDKDDESLIQSKKFLTLPPLTPDEKKVFDCIVEGATEINTILHQTDSSIQHVSAALTMLELKGYIKLLPGQQLQRI